MHLMQEILCSLFTVGSSEHDRGNSAWKSVSLRAYAGYIQSDATISTIFFREKVFQSRREQYLEFPANSRVAEFPRFWKRIADRKITVTLPPKFSRTHFSLNVANVS